MTFIQVIKPPLPSLLFPPRVTFEYMSKPTLILSKGVKAVQSPLKGDDPVDLQ